MRGATFFLLTLLVVAAVALEFHTYANGNCTGSAVTVSFSVGDCETTIFSSKGVEITESDSEVTVWCVLIPLTTYFLPHSPFFSTYNDDSCSNSSTSGCDTWEINQCHSAGDAVSYKVSSASQATIGVVGVVITLAVMFW
jgi:hypothetical protein